MEMCRTQRWMVYGDRSGPATLDGNRIAMRHDVPEEGRFWIIRMSKKAFDKIEAGLNDALKIARTGGSMNKVVKLAAEPAPTPYDNSAAQQSGRIRITVVGVKPLLTHNPEGMGGGGESA